VALTYATEAAKAFGVGESRTVLFEKERANRDVKADSDKKAKATRGK
jgi:CRISPR-associated protein Csb1